MITIDLKQIKNQYEIYQIFDKYINENNLNIRGGWGKNLNALYDILGFLDTEFEILNISYVDNENVEFSTFIDTLTSVLSSIVRTSKYSKLTVYSCDKHVTQWL